MKKLSHSHPFTAIKASYTSCQWKSTARFANACDTMMMMLNEALLVESNSVLIPLQTVQVARCGQSVCFCEPHDTYLKNICVSIDVSDVLTKAALITVTLSHIFPTLFKPVKSATCVDVFHRWIDWYHFSHVNVRLIVVIRIAGTPYSWPEHIYNYLSHY